MRGSLTFKGYLGLLLHDWAGLLGTFSLVGAFVPVIGPFMIIVAMVALPFAGYRVSRRLVNDHTARPAQREERRSAELAQREERRSAELAQREERHSAAVAQLEERLTRLVNDHSARVAQLEERHSARVAQREERLTRLERPAVPAYVRAAVDEAWKALPLTLQNVVRVLFVAGQMTDAEMVRELKGKLGAAAPNPLEGISNQSTLVERVEHTAGRREHLVEYRGPYQIQPAFRRALGELMGLEE